MCTMRLRIMREKIMLVDHIVHSEESSLAKLIYEASCPATPGLKMEVEEFMTKYDIRTRNYDESKNAYKNYIKKTIKEISAKEDFAILVTKSRTKHLEGEKSLGRQTYLTTNTLSQARFIFSCRSGTIAALNGNNYLIKSSERFCVACGRAEESQAHVLDCSVYADMKPDNPNLHTDTAELSSFFKMVLDRRSRILRRQLAPVNGSAGPPAAPLHSRPPPAPD